MKYLFIDTNIYVFCALLTKENHKPNTLEKLMKLLENGTVTLLIPEVVELEVYKKIDEEYENVKNIIKNFKSDFKANCPPFLGKDKQEMLNQIDNLIEKREESLKDAKNLFKEITSLDNVIKIPLKTEIFKNGYLHSLKGEAPYNGGHIIDADCMIVESLIHCMKENNIDSIIFCTNNKDDFAEFDQENDTHILHSDLRERLFNKSRLYLNLVKLLEQEFDEEIEQNQKEEKVLMEQILREFEEKKKLSKIQEEWKNIIAHIRKKNMKLGAFLRDATPLNVSDNKLILGFKHNFHKGQIEAKLELVQNSIEEFLNFRVEIVCVAFNENDNFKEEWQEW